jgi:hypothetical protein
MQGLLQLWQLDGAVQQSALLETHVRHVLVVLMQNGKARKNGVAVVAVVIDHVAAVGGGGPDILGEEFVLRLFRPVVVALGVAEVQPLHLLQEDDVGVARQALVESLWGYERDVEANTLDAFIRLLRQKIDRPGHESLIHTVRGVGYRLGEEVAS